MASAGSLWVEVLPRFVGGATAIKEQVVPAATSAGVEAGESIAKGVRSGTATGAAEAAKSIQTEVVAGAKAAATESRALLSSGMTSGLGKQIAADLASAEKAVADSALKIQAANAAAESSANKVAVAEAKLAEARKKYAGDSSQVIAAEGRLADAEAQQALAASKVEVATNDAAGAQARYAAAQKAASDEQVAATAKTTEASAAQGKLKAAINDTVPGVGNLSKQYAAMGALVAGAVVVGLGTNAVKAAAEFQSSQERLVTTAGELRSNLDMVDQGVLKMAGDVGISAQDLSKGMYTVESAGFHGADALTVMKAAAQGAKLENADLTTVTDAVTSAMQDYHMKAGDAALVTSKLITAVSDGKTTFQDLTGAMSAVLPVASSVGISMNEVLGDLSSMTLHGMSADQASQNLANAIRSLANPTLSATKELSALGLNAADLSKNLGKTGVQGTMEEISTAILQKMGPAGTTLLNAFNQSKQAAGDAATMFTNLPPKLQQMAKAMQDGKISQHDWTQGLKSIDPLQANLLKQWLAGEKRAGGFSDALKTGGNAAQTYTQALAKATGNSTSMNVALMLTGENAAKTKQNIADVSKATVEAGNNTKGWSEIQGTFAFKMAQLKDGLGALMISIGTKLLPILTTFAGALINTGHWLAENKTWIGLVAAVVGALAAPMLIVKTALMAWATATKVVAAAQTALNIVMRANPLVLIISAIAALVAGIIYAYTHFQWFRNIVAAVWGALKAAAEWVASAAVAAWHALVVAFDAVVTAAKAIGAAFVWLWNTILKPVFDVISVAVRILVAIIITVLVTPIVFAIKNVFAPIFTWLYNDVIKPVFDLIAGVFKWIYENIIKPIVAGIKIEIQLFADAINWLYNNVVKPVLNAIGDAWNWFYDNIIKPVVQGIKLELKMFEDAMNWLWQNVIKPILDAVSKAWNWFYDNVIKPVVAGIKAELKAWGDAFQWIYDNIIKPVGDFIGKVFHGIGQEISDVVDWIKSTWNKIMDIVKVPAKFVVDVVYNNAIVPVWNGIAGVFGLGKIDKVDVSKWAGGGILPGYQPGVDSIPAMLSPGEAVLVPEAARMLGYGNILALNAQASGRKPGNVANGMPVHAAGGGVFSDIGNFFSSAASKVWDGLKTVGGWVAKGVGAVTGEIGDLFSHIVDVAKGTPDQGNGNHFTEFLTHIPSKVIQGAIDAVKKWFSSNSSSNAGGGTGTIPDGQHLQILQAALSADGVPQNTWAKWLAGLNTLIIRESGWNASAVNNWDSNAAAGHPSKGLMQTIDSTFAGNRNPNVPGGIFDPVANVAAGINYIIRTYGDITNVQQANANAHPKGYAGGGIVPKLFDSGGWAEPGVTALVNASGRPEPVFSAGQWDVLKNNIRGGGGEHHYHITSHDPVSVAHEVERRQRAEMASKLSGL